jgi:high-affinity iron transporter
LSASPALSSEPAKRLLALIDYIGGDYGNAVAAGKIVNPLEYDEMLEFSNRSAEIFKQLKASDGDQASIEKELGSLVAHVREKSGDREVPQLAGLIKDRLITAYGIVTYPRTLPSLAAGRTVYLQNCAQCHGETGRGDGAAAATMQPKEPLPANFLDPDLMRGLSPFKAFNTTSFGIDGTAMPNFSALSEDERWQVAFYVMSLRHSAEKSAAGKQGFGEAADAAQLAAIDVLAISTDAELDQKLRSSGRTTDAEAGLAYLRRGLLEEKRLEPLLIARAYLQEAMDLYEKGNRQEAYQKSVDAYLDGFELAEPALSVKDGRLVRELEARFVEFRTSIRSGAGIERIREIHGDLQARLAQTASALGSEPTGSGTYALFNAALIIIREGLEAALIVGAIVAVLKATGSIGAVRYVHLGWILALLAGIVTWALAQTVLTVSGAQREVMEGLTSVIAALVLFWASYWLISKAEAKKWQKYIHEKVQEAVTGRRITALVGVSFLAVYREAFETVLFYQALWVQTPAARGQVIWGFLAGVALLALLVFTLFRLGLRIPLRHFFGASSVFLYLLAFVFAGQGIKDLQAAGWLSETPLYLLPRIPWLGIYPTVETFMAQAVMIAALVVALLWLGRGRWLGARVKQA